MFSPRPLFIYITKSRPRFSSMLHEGYHFFPRCADVKNIEKYSLKAPLNIQPFFLQASQMSSGQDIVCCVRTSLGKSKTVREEGYSQNYTNIAREDFLFNSLKAHSLILQGWKKKIDR